MRTDLDHLPGDKQRELERVVRIIFEESPIGLWCVCVTCHITSRPCPPKYASPASVRSRGARSGPAIGMGLNSVRSAAAARRRNSGYDNAHPRVGRSTVAQSVFAARGSARRCRHTYDGGRRKVDICQAPQDEARLYFVRDAASCSSAPGCFLARRLSAIGRP